MNIFEALIFGILQGIAEFLPISSSGHLLLAKRWFGLEEVPLIFDLALHVATLGAVILVFHKIIIRLMQVLFRWILRRSLVEDREDLVYIVVIMIATIVTAGLGVIIKDIELSSKMVYAGFLYTSAILILGSRITQPQKDNAPTLGSGLVAKKSWGVPLSGVIIGIFQGFAVLPGISRSGSTISAALFCGIRRDRAGEISFLLSIPTILGGFLLTLHDGQAESLSSQVQLVPLLIAVISAFFAGWLALVLLLRLIREMKLYYFVWYLVPLALLGLFGIIP
ncbi:undecaprenyl-diphosphate phosphatase [Entomospira entomophila]|uniref:Undecaprenyl-diphosphatase n=1 Tax=Entomospira entomophila TaxID=2719988 RepID=A0A968G7S9_9SPIO|nr:undecaprenyl-diphosphate phosphatase [Entomospira entomophilus]NIZ40158.1 undecaprenyl-diphosphate phosphatase [Entomospira entomophilus]WDI35716.1 undecaprenyl-diphosphate phosphatase [Entomospira entomophilus]